MDANCVISVIVNIFQYSHLKRLKLSSNDLVCLKFVIEHLNIVPHIQLYYDMIEDHNDIDHTWYIPNTRIWIKYTPKTFHIGVG